LAHPDTLLTVVQPLQVVVNVHPGLVLLGQERPYLARARMGEDDLVGVLDAVHLLQDDLTGVAASPVHARDVGLAWVAGNVEPGHIAGRAWLRPRGITYPHHADATGGVGSTRFGILEALELLGQATNVVDEVIVVHTARVELPEGNRGAVRAPAE